VGRVLRTLLGLILIAYVTPVYFRVPLRVVVGSLVLMLGFIAVYSLIFTSLRLIGSVLGSILMHGLIVALYIAGISRLPILGGGKGQLAAVTFLGISLVIAGMRALPGCELMAIPALFFRAETDVACPIFSPFDKLERKLRRKTVSNHSMNPTALSNR
jgi:hypothetical protein